MTTEGPVAGVVLAAGMGKRMGLPYPKVLVRVGGRTAIEHVLGNLRSAGASPIVIVQGPSSPRPSDVLAAGDLAFAVQHDRRGTAHALAHAEPALHGFQGDIVVVNGDMPLISPGSLAKLREERRTRGAFGALLVAPDPDGALPGLGRVATDDRGLVSAMVEARDLAARPAAERPSHVNVGAYLFGPGDGGPSPLWEALAAVGSDNVQGELYLTDVVGILAARGLPMAAVTCAPVEALGINTPDDLAAVEEALAGTS